MLLLALLAPAAHAHELERLCRSAVGDEVPTRAEYERDPKAHADNFCALLLYNQAAVLGQLGKVLKTNRAWANPNRHYFNPKFRPNAEYIQLLRPWMQRDGWLVRGLLDDEWRGEGTRRSVNDWYRYSDLEYDGHLGTFGFCPQGGGCVRLYLVRMTPDFASWNRHMDGDPVEGQWLVIFHASGNYNQARSIWPTAGEAKCYVERMLDALETDGVTADIETLRDAHAPRCVVE